jgi:hypothetical protein
MDGRGTYRPSLSLLLLQMSFAHEGNVSCQVHAARCGNQSCQHTPGELADVLAAEEQLMGLLDSGPLMQGSAEADSSGNLDSDGTVSWPSVGRRTVLRLSAKTGQGLPEVLPAIVR